jgi:hypothetical protein
MIQQNYFKINLGSDYKLKIQVIVKKPVEPIVEAAAAE